MKKQGLNQKLSRAALCVSMWMGMPAVLSAATVNLPITFSAEGHPVRTSACLQVKETEYSKQGWWQDSTGSDTPSEKAFKSVLTAIKRKDKAELLSLSDPQNGRDPKKFDEQAQAFFQQFETLEIESVPRAYEFDGLAVFYAKIKSKARALYAPFIFQRESDGSYGFLPYRTNQVTFRLVQDWFTAPWGPSSTDTAAYCSADDVKNANYKAQLVPDQDSNPSYVLFQGVPLENPGALAKEASQVKNTVQLLHTAASKGQPAELEKHMTPDGVVTLKKWWPTATDQEKTEYGNAIAEQQPYFLIDAAPLLVVYTKSAAGQIQVMYFVQQSGELYWANSAHVSVADKVFKQGPLRKSAGLKDPFTNIATK